MNCDVKAVVHSSIYAFNIGCTVDIVKLQMHNLFTFNNKTNSLVISLKNTNASAHLYRSGTVKIHGTVTWDDAKHARTWILDSLKDVIIDMTPDGLKLLSLSSTVSLTEIIDRFSQPKFNNLHNWLLDFAKHTENNYIEVSPILDPAIKIWINYKLLNTAAQTQRQTAFVMIHHTGKTILETQDNYTLYETIKWLFEQFGLRPNIKIEHKDDSVPPVVDGKKYLCQKCNLSRFKSKYLLNRHSKTCKSRPQGKFVCTIDHECQKYYSTNSNLKRHQLTKDPGTNTCNYWTKFDATFKNVIKHIEERHMLECHSCIERLFKMMKLINSTMNSTVNGLKKKHNINLSTQNKTTSDNHYHLLSKINKKDANSKADINHLIISSNSNPAINDISSTDSDTDSNISDDTAKQLELQIEKALDQQQNNPNEIVSHELLKGSYHMPIIFTNTEPNNNSERKILGYENNEKLRKRAILHTTQREDKLINGESTWEHNAHKDFTNAQK